MAPRLWSLLLAGIYFAGLGLSAPTSSPQPPQNTNLLNDASASSATTTVVSINGRRTRVFRLDVAALSQLSSVSSSSSETTQAPTYILDATLGLLETSADADVVPVFDAAKDKTVIVDSDGEVMTTYGDGKFIPVWARPWKSHSHGFRHTFKFSHSLAMFILGFSLALALVCAYVRGLCNNQNQLEADEFSILERGLMLEPQTQKSNKHITS